MKFWELITHYLFITRIAPVIIIGFFLIVLGIFSSSDINQRILFIALGIIVVIIILIAIKKWLDIL